MFNRIDKWFTTFVLKPVLKLYLNRDTWYAHKLLPKKLLIKKGVFHPAFFFSSEYLAEYSNSLPLSNTMVCEMCAGSGLLSFIAMSKRAQVYSIDISEVAVNGLKLNAGHLFPDVTAQIIQSDCFLNVHPTNFDYIFVNPPYFFKDPVNVTDYAWYCGAQGHFFQNFFSSLHQYTHSQSKVYMVLADNCEIDRIRAIANGYNWDMVVINSRKIRWEINTIFQFLPQ